VRLIPIHTAGDAEVPGTYRPALGTCCPIWTQSKRDLAFGGTSCGLQIEREQVLWGGTNSPIRSLTDKKIF